MARFTDYRTFKTAVGGRLLEFELGKICEQANGQVMVKYGESVVSVTVCASKEPREDIDFSLFHATTKRRCMLQVRFLEDLSEEREDLARRQS